VQVTEFPPIRVVRDDCQDSGQSAGEGRHYWALDNRRLWIFKKAGVERIPVKLLHPVTLQIAKELYDKV